MHGFMGVCDPEALDTVPGKSADRQAHAAYFRQAATCVEPLWRPFCQDLAHKDRRLVQIGAIEELRKVSAGGKSSEHQRVYA